MEESVISYAILTFFVIFGLIRLLWKGLQEYESRKYWDDDKYY